MTDDAEYLRNYRPDTLYVNPTARGTFATMVTETTSDELQVGEVEIDSRTRVAIKAFFEPQRQDFGSFKIVKIQYHARYGWRETESVTLSRFGASRIAAFSEVLSMLKLDHSKKARLQLGSVQLSGLNEILGTSEGANFVRALSESSNLEQDIIALAAKRKALLRFKEMLDDDHDERAWQKFFEENQWIFGHGLKYVYLTATGDKMEVVTTGSDFSRYGKKTDALLRSRAEVSQFVFVEIKRPDTPLLNPKSYRGGCWAMSDELTGAVTQCQKSLFEFSREYHRHHFTDDDGNDLPEEAFSVDPEGYLVAGRLSQLSEHKDKITCFELFRKSLRRPSILTFDELYYRAQFIIQQASGDNDPVMPPATSELS